MSNSQPKVEAFLAALKEQSFFKNESTPGSVLWYIAFYQKRAPQRRKAFHITGIRRPLPEHQSALHHASVPKRMAGGSGFGDCLDHRRSGGGELIL